MTRRGRKHLLKPLVFILAAMALEGCISPSADSVGRYTSPIGGAPVISNETPYSAALRCMSGIVGQHRSASRSARSPTIPARQNPMARAARSPPAPR